MFRERLPMKLQLFASDGASASGGTEGNTNSNTQNASAANQPPAIDYDKIQQMLNGTLAAKEDTALKSYFKQQGLSQEDAEKAMATFKAEKAKNQPDVGALQSQIAQTQTELQQARIETAATLAAVNLGIDTKTLPYVLKMADLSQVVKDGKVDNEAVKAALNKVLEDVPGLKASTQQQSTGFVQVGASSSGTSNQASQTQTNNSQRAIPTKRWNRWN